MLELINAWQFNTALFLLSTVFFFQFYKLAVTDAKNDGAATILLQIIAGISLLFYIPFFPIEWPRNWSIYLFFLASWILFGISDRLQTTARKHLEVSVYSIVSQIANVFLIIYGFILFKDPVVMTKIIGTGFILIGNALVFYKKGTFTFNKYTVLTAIAMLCYATAVAIDIHITRQFNMALYVALGFLIPAVGISIFEKISFVSLKEEFIAHKRIFYLITGLAWGLSVIFGYRAFQLGSVTTIVPIQATSVMLNVIVAYFFLREKDDVIKKLLAALLVILGITLTVL